MASASYFILLRSALLAISASLPLWAMSVQLESSVAPPVAVGTVLRWNAAVTDPGDGTVWYRYRVRTPGSARFRTVRDFSPDPAFQWAPMQAEGFYQVEVTARNRDTGETALSIASYDVDTRVGGGVPVLTPTKNELVFLYSAPPCPLDSRFRVNFVASDGFSQTTSVMACTGDKSMNVYIAGLRADTDYTVQHTILAADDAPTLGPVLTLRTGPLSFAPPVTYSLQKPQGRIGQGVLFQNRLFDYSVATDMDGNVIWYVPQIIQYLTRLQPGGYFFALYEDSAADDTGQILRKIDMAGNTVLETNAGRINEQLDALGKNHITSFHHEARNLPNGKILVLAGSERLMTDVQGPGEIDIIGDVILLLNQDLEVEWVWDAFEHLDVSRKAILNEKCVPEGGGCPIFRLAPTANDWLHGNSLDVAPDGNIIYSMRHQDWVIKIDFANGQGSGDVIWRAGKDGDFQMLSNDPSAWFSHQHDANILEDGTGSRLLLFDNGNTRYATDQSAHSRGQVIQLDEANRTATLLLNVDLGDFSRALGSAQQLRNGNFHFNVGWMSNNFSQAVEIDASGNLVNQLEAATQQYRSFRLRSLYLP